jgi:hypothetical protein
MDQKLSKEALDYRGEDDHRTLSRAAEITSDKSRMDGAKKHHMKQKRALGKVGTLFGKK